MEVRHALVISLALALVACGGKGSGGEDDTSTDVPQDTAVEDDVPVDVPSDDHDTVTDVPEDPAPDDGDAPEDVPEDPAPDDGDAPEDVPVDPAPDDGDAPEDVPVDPAPDDGDAPDDVPADETDGDAGPACIGEGDSGPVIPFGPECCAGLTSVSCATVGPGGLCEVPLGVFCCTYCGDLTCGLGENVCNCPGDCS